MRRIRYSVAMSLDGYIAGPNGEYDWIELDPSAAGGYFKAFYAQFVTVLGADALERVAALREEPGKDIWLWGGGEAFGSLAEAGLVDGVEIGLAPVLLGSGRKVMEGCGRRIKLAPRAPELQLPGYTL